MGFGGFSAAPRLYGHPLAVIDRGPPALVGVNERFAPARRRRRRHGGGLLISFLILLVLLWCGYWFAAYSLASAAIGVPGGDPPRFGSTATCADRAFSGFPGRVSLDCTTLQANAPGIDASIAGLKASAPLYNPGALDAVAEGPLLIDADAFGVGVQAAWDRAEASARADLSGLARASSTADELRVILTGPAAPVTGFSVGRWHGSVEQIKGAAAGLRLVFEAENLQVADAAGALLPSVSSDGRMTLLEAGPVADVDLPALVAAWVAEGGQLQIERLSFATGDVGFAVAGPLTLAPSGLLSGTLTMRIFGTDRLAGLIATVFPQFAAEANNIAGALVALTTTVETPAGPAQETRLTLRDGVLSVGFVKLLDIPALELGR